MKIPIHEMKTPWPKSPAYNARLIPNKLIELAKAGTYFDSRIIN